MRSSRNRLLAAAVALSMAAGTAAFPARAAVSDDQATIDHALGTLQDLRGDKEFGNARDLLHRARAVLIAPRIFKAGFFVGGEGGQALLLVRGAHGWSDPAFYTVGSASFGLQIGAQESELIMFVMSGTTAAAGADIVVWASSSGAYAGISLDGTVISADLGEDRRYYGRPVSSGDIVLRRDARNARAGALLQALNTL